MLEVLIDQAVEPVAAPVQLLLERDHLGARGLGLAPGGIERGPRRHLRSTTACGRLPREGLRQRIEPPRKVERIWFGKGELLQLSAVVNS